MVRAGESGRDVLWVLGADYRREAGSLAPDPLHALAIPLLPLGRHPSWVETDDVRELFAEVQLPLLHGRRWARDMALNIGLRWSDSSSFDSTRPGRRVCAGSSPRKTLRFLLLS